MLVTAGALKVLDTNKKIPVANLKAHGIVCVALYLKYWDPIYVKILHDAGIATICICEVVAGDALGGAPLGIIRANRAVIQAVGAGVPQGETIIMCHDTGTYTAEVPRYFAAAEGILRGAGYAFGGYVMKDVVNDSRSLGVVFDLIWATAAGGWQHGRHPDSHVFQKLSSVMDGRWGVDYGDVRFTFNAWLPGSPVLPPVTPPAIVGPDRPPTLNPNFGGIMQNAILVCDKNNTPVAQQFDAAFVGVVNDHGAALFCDWTGDGSNPAVGGPDGLINAHTAAGMITLGIARSDLRHVKFLGAVLPAGFTKADFAPGGSLGY